MKYLLIVLTMLLMSCNVFESNALVIQEIEFSDNNHYTEKYVYELVYPGFTYYTDSVFKMGDTLIVVKKGSCHGNN